LIENIFKNLLGKKSQRLCKSKLFSKKKGGMNFLIERFGLEGRILLNKVIFTGEFQGA